MTDTDRGLLVSEVFGPTVQGEGPNTGRRCGFIRLGLCNLDCSWCDTPYTWDWERFDKGKELTRTSPVALLEQVRAMKVDRVVITGGEPLVQRVALEGLVGLLAASGYTVEVETNGTISPGALGRIVGWWNVSPKLTHSGVAREKAWKPQVLQEFGVTNRAAFKFVCSTPADLDEVEELCALARIPPDRVWIMPEGRTPGELAGRLPELTEAALGRSFNVTSRLHVEVWGDRRGH